MRAALALVGAFFLFGCGAHAPNEYPANAHASFNQMCPASDATCGCIWDKVTRDMTYDEYDKALAHFRETGSMDPRITHARTVCREHAARDQS